MTMLAAGPTGMPFDIFFTYDRGYIARQVEENEDDSLILTWRQDLRGACHVSVPVNTADLADLANVTHLLSKYET